MKDSIYNYCKPGTVFFKSFPECEPGTNFQEIIRRAEQIAQDTFFEVVEVGTIKDVLYRTRVSTLSNKWGVSLCHTIIALMLMYFIRKEKSRRPR